jgi:phosphate starvation-inducible PhoH-like protein
MTQVTLPEEGIEALFGAHDENLRRMERAFGVDLAARGQELTISGDAQGTRAVERLIGGLGELVESGHRLRPNDVRTAVRVIQDDPDASLVEFFRPEGMMAASARQVTPRTLRQHGYLKAMIEHDIVISIGPAGTGKTYLAVAMAAAHLLEKKVRRIVLARPAVEAGEKLGFLPGDLVEKVNPYLRPLYDALYDIIGYEKVTRMLERQIIEVAPIAFMRGRTLNDSFIILDEAQNTTTEQMKMFLTRIGFGSKAVVNGDVTQVDLPDGRRSGLRVAEKVLANIDGIAFFRFNEHDVVRHNLVQKVITAYDRYEKEQEAEREARKNGGDRRGPRTAREPVEAPLKVQEEG